MSLSSASASPLPTTELPNPDTENLDRLPTVEMLARINDEDAKVTAAVQKALPQIAKAVDAAAAGLRAGGRLIYVGAGTSGRLGVLDAAECLPTFGVSPEQVFGIIAGGPGALLRAVEGAEDDRDAGIATMDEHRVGKNDVVVGISASGGAPYVRGAVTRAKERGAVTVSVANSPNAPLSGDVDIPIEVVTGPEVITGSTRLKAGTGQKLTLNMISTGAMVRIGKTYGNRMVDVQATNIKLVGRAKRLIREIGGVESDERAAELLNAAGGSVKKAIVMARREVDAETATRLLTEADGFLSVVVDSASAQDGQ
jgi:N-acetylmuramic acid 6-phosphate etherase